MKTILRNAALALSILSLGAVAARPVSMKPVGSTKVQATMPVPVCPVSDPHGCGIYD